MTFFSKLPLFAKLTLSFAVIGSLSVALGGVAVNRLGILDSSIEQVTSQFLPHTRQILIMRADMLEDRTYQLAVLQSLYNPPKDETGSLASYLKRHAKVKHHFDEAKAAYASSITSDEERQAFTKLTSLLDSFWTHGDAVYEAAGHADKELATTESYGSRDARRDAADLMQTIGEADQHRSEAGAASAQALYHNGRLVLMIGTLATLLMGIAIGGFLARSISRATAHAREVAEGIAQGRLDQVIDLTRHDEIGALLNAMDGMQRQLNGFAEGQLAMARAHEAGQIGVRMDGEPFAGTFKALAEQTNRLVDGHIQTSEKVVAVVKQYAEGDFSATLEPLRGERARINEAIDGVKNSFVAISDDVVKLVEAARRGDFTARGEASRYQHQFRLMVDGLNALMQQSDAGLSELADVLNAVAGGDLTRMMRGNYQGTFEALKRDMNHTVTTLRTMVSDIQKATSGIHDSAREIAAGNMDLSSRTENQASSLQETAASMEELTQTVKGSAESAREANELTRSAAEVVTRGEGVVAEVVDTMDRIASASRRISDIIAVIDGIAFQTNILALNAAVEAARAGEQGRGFAVVASEVRTLAQRSAEAAKEIKGLIGASTEQVSLGTERVQLAGSTMQDILKSVNEVAAIVAAIDHAAAEQSIGIAQVNQAVSEMDRMTQQNAALVEQAAAAAGAMEQQAVGLAGQVERFRMHNSVDSVLPLAA